MFAVISLWELWKALAIPRFETNTSENTFKSDARLVLIKFANGMMHEESKLELEGLRLKYFLPTMTELEVSVSRVFANPNSVDMVELQDIASSIRLHLDIFETCLDTANEPLSSTYASQLAELLVGKIRRLSLLIIDFLGLLHKYIPIQGLSRVSETLLTPIPSAISDLFKGMKRDVITILTLLLHLNKQLQDTIREKGGIPLILSQCNIDDDNPCTSFFITGINSSYQRESDTLYSSPS
jgi:hypothetical protein